MLFDSTKCWSKQRLIRDNVQGEKEAKDVHYEVGKKVRKAIADIGGMMPEENANT